MASDVCDRCGKPEVEHHSTQQFCPFYSTFRARTPPPEDGPVVWVARDDYAELPVRLFHAEPVMRLNGQYQDANGMSGWPVPGSPDAFGLTPGECRAFRLVPVREGK